MEGLEEPPVIGIDAATVELDPPIDLHTACDSRMGALETERNAAQDRAATAIAHLEVFQEQVRDVAIRAHKDGIWCRSGMNEKLEELGLELYHPRYRVVANVVITATVDNAEDDSQAQSWFQTAIGVQSSDDDVEAEIDDIQIRYVEQDDE